MIQRPFPSASRCRGNATALAVFACSAGAAFAADAPALSVELNKLEPYEKGCRAYVVMNNPGEQAYQSFKADLVLFQQDGVITRRFLVDLGPLRAAKKTVKLFDIEGLACEKIASVLVNDITECKSDGAAITDCLAKITLSSVAGAPLSK